MQINIIAACDNNGVIGVNGKLPFHIPEDLKRFKELTLGHAVIMGRVTWESLPVKPLLKRYNFVLSESNWTTDSPKAFDVESIQEVFDIAEDVNIATGFIIGGERLYTEALPLADRVYLTRVDTVVDVVPEDTVARFPLADMQALFRVASEDKRDGFAFTEWVRSEKIC